MSETPLTTDPLAPAQPANASAPLATEEQITELVRRFYELARADGRLGPLFDAAIQDYDGHMAIVRDFWSQILLGTGRYQGHPFRPHMHLPIELDHFDIWLKLFGLAARETLAPRTAELALARAEHMTKSFKVGMFPFTAPDGRPARKPG